MAAKKTVVKKAVVEKEIEVVIDPVVEAQNLLLEIEQAEQDIEDIIAQDMIRAKVEHAAVIANNLKKSNHKRQTDIHMATKAVQLAQDTLKQVKVGPIVGRYKVIIDLMYGFDKEDSGI